MRLAQVIDLKRFKDLVKDHAVQVVYQCPAQLARHHPAHGRLIACAPGQGEFTPVHAQTHRVHFTGNAAMPVDHGTKDVKGQHFDGVWRGDGIGDGAGKKGHFKISRVMS